MILLHFHFVISMAFSSTQVRVCVCESVCVCVSVCERGVCMKDIQRKCECKCGRVSDSVMGIHEIWTIDIQKLLNVGDIGVHLCGGHGPIVGGGCGAVTSPPNAAWKRQLVLPQSELSSSLSLSLPPSLFSFLISFSPFLSLTFPIPKIPPSLLPQPLFIGYLNRSAYFIWLLPWMIWRLVGTYRGRWSMEERERSIACERYLSLWAVPMGFLLFVVGYTWYLSLAHTAVSINTAIYNCLGVCGWRRCRLCVSMAKGWDVFFCSDHFWVRDLKNAITH